MVFISYRREDSAGEARALYNELTDLLGPGRVFMDVDDIALGKDFRRVLEQRLERCEVMLVLIGKAWLDARSGAGQRRLDDAGDFVRFEIATALRRNIAVTPVLIHREASMPAAAQLPEDIRDLAFRNGFEVSQTRWQSDVRELVRRLALTAAPPSTAPQTTAARSVSPAASAMPAAPATGGGGSAGRLAAIGALAVALALGGWYVLQPAAPTPPAPALTPATDRPPPGAAAGAGAAATPTLASASTPTFAAASAPTLAAAPAPETPRAPSLVPTPPPTRERRTSWTPPAPSPSPSSPGPAPAPTPTPARAPVTALAAPSASGPFAGTSRDGPSPSLDGGARAQPANHLPVIERLFEDLQSADAASQQAAGETLRDQYGRSTPAVQRAVRMLEAATFSRMGAGRVQLLRFLNASDSAAWTAADRAALAEHVARLHGSLASGLWWPSADGLAEFEKLAAKF